MHHGSLPQNVAVKVSVYPVVTRPIHALLNLCQCVKSKIELNNIKMKRDFLIKPVFF